MRRIKWRLGPRRGSDPGERGGGVVLDRGEGSEASSDEGGESVGRAEECTASPPASPLAFVFKHRRERESGKGRGKEKEAGRAGRKGKREWRKTVSYATPTRDEGISNLQVLSALSSSSSNSPSRLAKRGNITERKEKRKSVGEVFRDNFFHGGKGKRKKDREEEHEREAEDKPHKPKAADKWADRSDERWFFDPDEVAALSSSSEDEGKDKLPRGLSISMPAVPTVVALKTKKGGTKRTHEPSESLSRSEGMDLDHPDLGYL